MIMKEQKIKQDDIFIGANIRRIRKEKHIGQTELVRIIQLSGIPMTRETIVKIERGIQHIYASQLKAIKEALDTSYDELLKSNE
jgi:transcriptional regulator with XRE-family HTH domain